MQHVENDLDVTIEKLSSTNTKYDDKDKAFQVPTWLYYSNKRSIVCQKINNTPLQMPLNLDTKVKPIILISIWLPLQIRDFWDIHSFQDLLKLLLN